MIRIKKEENAMKVEVKEGIGLGTIIAVLASWTKWHSIGWAIVHGFFGWLYVIYYLLTK